MVPAFRAGCRWLKAGTAGRTGEPGHRRLNGLPKPCAVHAKPLPNHPTVIHLLMVVTTQEYALPDAFSFTISLQYAIWLMCHSAEA